MGETVVACSQFLSAPHLISHAVMQWVATLCLLCFFCGCFGTHHASTHHASIRFLNACLDCPGAELYTAHSRFFKSQAYSMVSEYRELKYVPDFLEC